MISTTLPAWTITFPISPTIPSSGHQTKITSLNTYLVSLNKFLSKWRVKSNPTKTSLAIFRLSCFPNPKSNFRIVYWNQVTTPFPSASYLRMHLNQNISRMSNYSGNASTKDLILIKYLRLRTGSSHPKSYLPTYKTFIHPVIDYSHILSTLIPNGHGKKNFLYKYKFIWQHHITHCCS